MTVDEIALAVFLAAIVYYAGYMFNKLLEEVAPK